MKKLVRAFVMFGLCIALVACGSSSNNNEDKDKNKKSEEKKEETKESALEKVEKVFTLTIEEDSTKSIYVYANLGGEEDPRFTYYAKIGEAAEGLASAFKIKVGDLAYENYQYSYLVGAYTEIYSHIDVTATDVKKEVEDTLSQKGITLDELKAAMKEKYEAK